VLAKRRSQGDNDMPGRLAQLVERLLYTQDVGGSSPSPPTNRSKQASPRDFQNKWHHSR
jgi:hypothetical protein